MGKKFIVLSMLFLLLLSGCSRLEQTKRIIDAPSVSTKKDSVKDSDLTEIILDENPSTGYLWQFTLEPEGIVEVVKDEYLPKGDPDADGAGGEHVWGLKGVKEGTATMTFICCREGDEEENSGETIVYQITVRPDGNLDLYKENSL